MRIGRIGMMMAVALLAAACGGGDADEVQAPAADTTAAPPTASAPAETAAADSAAWTLSDEGIGPLRVGMTVDEARAALGGDFQPLENDDPSPEACTYARSGAIPAGVQVMLVGGRVARVEVDSGSTATGEGARIGDDAARVRQLYGAGLREMPHKYTAGRYLIAVSPADTLRRLVFETDSAGRVERFRGGVFPPVEYVEGCA